MNLLKNLSKTNFFVGSIIIINYTKFTLCEKKNLKFSKEDLKNFNTMEKGIYVSFKNGVYDITNFVGNHPGGIDKIMLSAGTSVDQYWNLYKQHINNKYVIEEILKPMKIGELTDYDPNIKFDDPYINEPLRDSDLKFHTFKPCNAETPKNEIMNNWITPNNLWYIRNHNPVPIIDHNNYILNISYKDKLNTYNLHDLKNKFSKKKVISTIQCAGNKRSFFEYIKKTNGTPWDIGAISTAEWTGVPLIEIIKDLNLDPDIKFIEFCSEEDVKISIPIEKGLNPYGDVLLAYEMNGEQLPREHGFPLRLIVPGYVGIRNLKWIKSISFRSTETEGSWQSGIAYKGFPHYIDNVNNLLVDKYVSVNEFPVQSVIIKDEGEYIDNLDDFKIRGFALSGGGRGIIRVDLSIDNGISWHSANLTKGSEQNINKAWAWTFWELKLGDIIKERESNINEINVICKATDSSYNVQPENPEYIWNLRGLNHNSWHKVKFKFN